MVDKQNPELRMASLDVDSLFTNIPLTETIEIVVDKLYRENVNGLSLSKREFKEMLILATSGTVFYFNGNYFRQKDGAAMGSPLGPALANAFLCHHEGTWLQSCPKEFAPAFYSRYVDDIFILLYSIDHAQLLANYFSSKHRNINFTFELEQNQRLPFLDVMVFRDETKIVTSIHRKSTFSGVYTNFKSFIPSDYKRGLVLTLLHRAYTINSSYEGIHNEITKLREILQRNGYAEKFIDRCILNFFNKIYEVRKVICTVPNKEIMIVLPFLGTTPLAIKKNIVRSVERTVPYVKVMVIFKTGNRIGSWFRFKDMFPPWLQSGVVYKYTCAKCNFSYIGSTFRYFEKRLEEHLHISALTGKPLNGLPIWAPMAHTRNCQIHNSGENFSIIGKEKDKYLLRMKESLLIHQLKPELNTMIESVKLDLFN